MDEWMEGGRDGWMNGELVIDEWMGWMEGWRHEWRVDGWMDGCVNE